MKIFAVVGRSNSGKTTLVEKLVRHYTRGGLKVSTIKSIRHDYEMDHPGKDSYRHREAGAFSSAITSGKKFSLISTIDDDMTPLELAQRYFSHSDLVIIEGYKEGDTQKIEVVGDSSEDPLFLSGVDNILLVASDNSLETVLPQYRRDDVEGILRGIEDLILKTTNT